MNGFVVFFSLVEAKLDGTNVGCILKNLVQNTVMRPNLIYLHRLMQKVD